MLIFNGVVHPVDAPVIPNGYVELEDDKIKGVGPMEALPKGCEGPSLDVKGGHIVPGFVDAHCHLGLFGDALKFEGDDGNEATNPCTPHVRAIDGVNPLDRCFQEAREGGVTTVLTGPGSANPISGQGIVIKTLGAWVDQMVLKAPATMKMALGENPKTVYNGRKETPTTRMGTASVIRTELARALEYMDRQDKADTEAGTNAPGYDPRLEALIPVLRGELPVHIHAHRADDIATGIRICKEFGLEYVIVHGTEGHLIANELAREGALVVSGIAQGLDTEAVRGALKGGGPVVSVLGCGIDVAYPRENRFLYEDVAATGALLSEYPPGTPPEGWHFPVRNRIISGVSLGVVAVECGVRSGTMTTVRQALDQDRDVFAVPGNADAPMSEGPNRLIQQGARLVTCARDVLREYEDRFPGKVRRPVPLSGEEAAARLEPRAEEPEEKHTEDAEKAVDKSPERAYIDRSALTDDQIELLAALEEKKLLADDLIELTQIPARRVLSALTMLQVQGYVAERPGRRFEALVWLKTE